MLSKKVHVMLGIVEVNKVESWAKKQIRFEEAITKHSFQEQVEQVYYDLMALATNKGFSKWEFEELNSIDKFLALIKRNIAIRFAEEVSKEPFLEKSHEEVEKETVSSADWITEQISRSQMIIQEKIQSRFREKALSEYREKHLNNQPYEYDECDCYND